MSPPWWWLASDLKLYGPLFAEPIDTAILGVIKALDVVTCWPTGPDSAGGYGSDTLEAQRGAAFDGSSLRAYAVRVVLLRCHTSARRLSPHNFIAGRLSTA